MKQVRTLWCLALLLPALAGAAGPNVQLKAIDGSDRNLRDYVGQGKWTVVAIWAHDCTICKQEIHQMSFFHDAHKDKNAQVLGISIDGYARKKQVQRFITDQGLDFPNLIGDPSIVAKIGGGLFVGTPTFYVFSPTGKLLAEQVGPVTQEQVEAFIAKAAAKL